jgi:hypothetical protein
VVAIAVLLAGGAMRLMLGSDRDQTARRPTPTGS